MMTNNDDESKAEYSKFRKDIDITERALSMLAWSCIEDEGSDPVAVAAAARDVSLMLAECLRPSEYYSLVKDWEGIADRSIRTVAAEKRKRNRLLAGLDETSARH